MAADSRCSAGGTVTGNVDKIFKNKRGDLCGVCGSSVLSAEFARWFLNKERGPVPKLGSEDSSISAMVVRSGLLTKVEIFEGAGSFEFSDCETGSYYATGSGYEIALGAMHAGASAFDAVRAAIHHDTRSGGPIRTLRLGRD